MGLRSQKRGEEYTIVSRAPYLTALAISKQWLTTSSIGFAKSGDLVWLTHARIESRAQNDCPYRIVDDHGQEFLDAINTTSPREDWISPQGRHLKTIDGRILDVTNGTERELVDLGPSSFTEVQTPDWAKSW